MVGQQNIDISTLTYNIDQLDQVCHHINDALDKPVQVKDVFMNDLHFSSWTSFEHVVFNNTQLVDFFTMLEYYKRNYTCYIHPKTDTVFKLDRLDWFCTHENCDLWKQFLLEYKI